MSQSGSVIGRTVPVTKKPPKGGLKWWRSLVAPFFVFVIAVFFYFETAKIASSRGIICECHSTTECCLTQGTQITHAIPNGYEIIVLDRSDKIQTPLTRENALDFSGVKNATVADLSRESEPWTNQSIISKTTCSRVCGSGWDFIVGRPLGQSLSRRKQNGFEINPRNITVSIADIHNIQIKLQRTILPRSVVVSQETAVSHPYVFQTHPRTMGGNKFFSGKFNRLVSDAPQFFRRKPQSGSEYCQGDCENSSDGVAVAVSKINNRGQADKHRTRERGAFLLFLGIVAAAGFGTYWVASKQR